ncbi:MAG TPA: FAD/NAD(P)-binding protein [Polyangiaceae bacterium]
MSVQSASRTVAVIGGGAVGASLLYSLIGRLSSESPARARTRLVLFEKSGRIGPGLAYAKDESPYLLNQSAQTMSLVPGRRAHFGEWLESRGVSLAGGEDLFCPRQLFGDYVEDCVAGALEGARRSGLPVSTIRGEVSSLTPRRFGGYRVVAAGHAPIDADVVVLALGNLPSSRFRALEGPGFVASPYPSAEMCARIPGNARVAILGSGLSAIDAALALFAAGHTAPVTMASRGGMLPAVRGPLRSCELHHVTRANVALATDQGRRPLRWGTVVGWIERELAVRDLSVSWDRDFPAWVDPLEHYTSQVAAAERGERVWQSIGETLNPMMEVVWHHLADADKRLFLDRVYSRFMSHWVPVPLETGRRVLGLLREGKLVVERNLAGTALDADAGAYRLRFAERLAMFDFVVDASGAPRHLSECRSPLLEALLRQGTIAAHDCGGLRVDFESLRVLGTDGRSDPHLFAVGQLTCGTHFFTSTLEYNVQKGDRVAARIVSELQPRGAKDQHAEPPPDPT